MCHHPQTIPMSMLKRCVSMSLLANRKRVLRMQKHHKSLSRPFLPIASREQWAGASRWGLNVIPGFIERTKPVSEEEITQLETLDKSLESTEYVYLIVTLDPETETVVSVEELA